MILYFENRYGQRRVIGCPATIEGARRVIQDFLDAHNYKSYYTREWEENGEHYFDVGSHVEMFVMVEDEHED